MCFRLLLGRGSGKSSNSRAPDCELARRLLTEPAVSDLSALAEILGLESRCLDEEGLKKRLKRRGVTVGGLLGLLLLDGNDGGEEGMACEIAS